MFELTEEEAQDDLLMEVEVDRVSTDESNGDESPGNHSFTTDNAITDSTSPLRLFASSSSSSHDMVSSPGEELHDFSSLQAFVSEGSTVGSSNYQDLLSESSNASSVTGSVASDVNVNSFHQVAVPEIAVNSVEVERTLEIERPVETESTVETEGTVETESIVETEGTVESESTVETESDGISVATNSIQVETPSRKRKANEIDDDDGQLCSICLDYWTNSGDHRICALKCGHLYGHKCIMRWISENKKCPTCKLKALKNDIRFIYANKLIALDTSELNEVKQLLSNSITEKNMIQIQLSQAICKEHMLLEQIAQYKEKISFLSNNTKNKSSSSIVEYNTNMKTLLKHFETYQVCQQGTCRVMDSHYNQKLLAVSLKSPNSLFRGFGIKKYNIENMSSVVFIPLHTNAVRDIKFNQMNNYLLSVSLDKVAKVIDIHTNNVVASYECQAGLWSCCWDANEEHVFYVGNQQGAISKFDLRRMSNPIDFFSTPGDLSPVVSLAALRAHPENAVPAGGFLACKLNSLWAFGKGSTEYQKHSLPALGPFISMNYDQDNQTILLSCRPTGSENSVRNIVYSLEKGEAGPNSVLSHTFFSGRIQKQLTRTCLLKNNKNVYVAASNEQTIMLWSTETGKVSANLRNGSLAIDLMPFSNGQRTSLLALSEKKLDLYNFIDSIDK